MSNIRFLFHSAKFYFKVHILNISIHRDENSCLALYEIDNILVADPSAGLGI